MVEPERLGDVLDLERRMPTRRSAHISSAKRGESRLKTHAPMQSDAKRQREFREARQARHAQVVHHVVHGDDEAPVGP